jgi:hypothetical protein
VVQFTNPEVAEKFECTSEKDHSVIIISITPQFRGKVSKATIAACEQMIAEGVDYIKRKVKK